MLNGEAIRAARERHSLTQKAVADACGVVELTVWRWEHDPPRDIGSRAAATLIDLLGLTEDELFCQTPSATSPAMGSADGAD